MIYRKLEHFNSWPMTDPQKWIRTTKRIIRKAASQKLQIIYHPTLN